jgi:transposase-like protein
MKKDCKKCKEWKTIKYGKRWGKQTFLCKDCWYIWELWKWKTFDLKKIGELYHRYVNDELKYRQIAQELWVSKVTVKNMLDKFEFNIFLRTDKTRKSNYHDGHNILLKKLVSYNI